MAVKSYAAHIFPLNQIRKLLICCLLNLCLNCASTNTDQEEFASNFTTALFSFLYHLSSYETGGEALVQSGMMGPLLNVVITMGDQQDQTTASSFCLFIFLLTSDLNCVFLPLSTPYMIIYHIILSMEKLIKMYIQLSSAKYINYILNVNGCRVQTRVLSLKISKIHHTSCPSNFG